MTREGSVNDRCVREVQMGRSFAASSSSINATGENTGRLRRRRAQGVKHRRVKRYTPHRKAGVHREKSSTR